MLNEEVAKYRELSGDTNPNTPISRIGGYLDGYEKALEQEPCDDAISRIEVIKLIDEREDVNGKVDAESVRTDIVLLPPVTPQPKWIPVSERLPENNVEVLVTTEWDCITIGEMFSSNDWFIYEGATNADIDDIKAWMPLPKPYEPQESEET